METTTRILPIDDIEVHVAERGAGEPLLLLHGLTGSGGDFVHLFDLDALARDYRVIAPDARAHGRTTDAGTFSLTRCARDLVALLDALAIDRVRAVGVSLGALTLLHVAAAAPSRIARMVLVSAVPRFPPRALGMMRDAGGLAARLVEAGPDDLAFTRERLGAITADALLVAGDRDPLYDVELAVELYRGLPRASLYVVPNGGHSPVFLAEREAFAQRALRFLHAPEDGRS